MRICLTVVTIFGIIQGHSAEQLELRIHEGADVGSRLTMGIELQRKIEPLKSCFGQLETDVQWIEFRSTRGAFYTVETVPYLDSKTSQQLEGTLHLMCTGNRMHSLHFHIHITRKNRHPPTFSGGSQFTFYIPTALSMGALIGKLEVVDHDPVIYNSQRQLKFTTEQNLFNVYSDGAVILKDDLSTQTPYKPIQMQVLAIDYGSPQLFSIANLTIIPVTVSQVRELKVNVATDSYQIFEWEKPEYGHAIKYRLSISKGESVFYEEELDAKHTTALTKVSVDAGGDFSYSVTAISLTGETPSEVYRFTVLHKDLRCSGECYRNGGVPLCYYGQFQRLEQFHDDRGLHCQCFHGYTGVTCQHTDACQPEKTMDSYGGLDWPETKVNFSVSVPCPYNSDGEQLRRQCSWDPIVGRAVWKGPQNADKCKPQISVLTHLGMIGTFAEKADSVSTIHTVVRFLRTLLTVPSLSKNDSSPAHFDQKIAEEVTQVVDSVLRVNFTKLKGNATLAQEDMWEVLRDFSTRIPIPFAVASPRFGLHIRTSHWIARAENYKTLVGPSCFVQLSAVAVDNSLRAICMQNATLFPVVDTRNPVLSLKTDTPMGNAFTRIRFGLRPFKFNISDNYTCVHWNSEENGWSTKGIHRIAQNEHGYVLCESDHLSVFSLLPESIFYNDSPFLRDFGVLLPTVTTFITIICSIFLLFLAAVQRGSSIDFAMLFFLFFAFLIHCVHLLMLIGPQVGDPFVLSPALHLVFQFCVLSVSATLCLLLSSLHTFLSKLHISRVKEKESDSSCSRPSLSVLLGIVCPSLLTFSTYYFANEYKHDLRRVFNRVDWLFLLNYLCPTVLFLSLALAFAVWNVYIGYSVSAHRRSSSERVLALSPARSASTTSIGLILFFISLAVLFNLRETSATITILFCVSQIAYCCSVFLFAGYLFRVRYLTDSETDNGSTRSLERKRDISRALLEHVDAKGSDISSLRSDSGHFLSQLTNNLYERQPMVSIV